MDIPEVTFWIWYPVLTILLCIPVFCYYDYKFREIPGYMFGILFLLNFPVLVFQYLDGNFGWEEFIVSIIPCILYYAIMRVYGDYFHGDDMIFLVCISLFCVVNPIRPDAGALPVTVMIYLAGTLAMFFGVALLGAVFRKRRAIAEGEASLANIVMGTGMNYPMMFPISAAFIIAVLV